MATNISWKDKVTNKQLYKRMTTISDIITQRRLRLAGQFIKHTNEIAHNLMLWKLKNVIRNRGDNPRN